jgi:ribonucleotide monophosphatase NagD (HAD superfamily)
MVGDRPSTDGMFGRRLGARFALVRSGVTAPGVAVDDPTPDLDAADLATLVAQQLGDAP